MANIIATAGKAVGKYIGNKVVDTVLKPVDGLIDQNLSDIATTFGSFVIRAVRGKFQRSITFEVGLSYYDAWLEVALYGILYEWNNIKSSSKLEYQSRRIYGNNTQDVYYRLGDGFHNLKYRKWDIMLAIQTKNPAAPTGRIMPITMYTIISYDLSPEFVKCFEQDMIRHRNSILKISADNPMLNIYKDMHESDGYTYWEKIAPVYKRKLNTIYLPKEQKKILVNTINEFFAMKQFYIDHGIPHNLKILMHGGAGTGKSSIVKMIASEWNRNLYECTGGKNGKFIPNAITDYDEGVISPLFSISDIDKYPTLINEADTDMTDKTEGKTDEQLAYRQQFNNMINALDGITSGDDRIIVMTTNHIEKFSKTFLRPGRCDLIMEIGYVVPEVFRKYTYDFYHIELPKDIKLTRNNITIAEMQFDVINMKLSSDEFIKKYVK